MNLSTSTLDISASISSNEQVSTSALMRSRAPMGKCCPHLVQTFRLSSSSLSKIMVEHLGHFCHRPSGMSRFLDLVEPSLGFFAKLASVPAGGGVTAGSAVSRPRVFLVKVVVAMAQEAG